MQVPSKFLMTAGRSITIDGKPRILLSGSIHYPRSTPEMWPELIKKSKEGGLDAIETYVFWNAHEPVSHQYDFTGNLDLIKFIKTVQDAGLYVVLRIGPYVCAEWNYGGLPVWLHNLPGCQIRTANDVFMNEMKNFTTMIVDMAKRGKLFASQGGPIIIAQKDDPIWGKNNITLRINGTGCILHAYVNGEHIGSDQAARNFERNVTLKDGRNIISLLSATTGFSNGDETVIKDLSAHKWSYKVGLHGLTNKLFSSEKGTKWSSENLPVNTTMTWYKTTFKAPLGTDPIVVDLQVLGKRSEVFVPMHIYENNTLELACDGRSISAIKFASFGNPQGTCGPFKNGTSFTKGTCDGSNALSIIQKECVGKEKCSIDVSGDKFDSTNCGDIVKRLAVEAVCYISMVGRLGS
ncbi:hypothetical protein ACLB2K_003154 [Fragaria x ananassa]